MKTVVNHTWHHNTFGLLYGKTTKTACGKRVATSRLVKPVDTTCENCQRVVIQWLKEFHEMYQGAIEIVQAQGYDTIEQWLQDNPYEWKGRRKGIRDDASQ